MEVNSSNDNSGSKKNKAYFYCKKKGHFNECRFWKKMKKEHVASSSNEVNVVEEQVKELVAMVSNLHVSLIIEVHVVAFLDTNGWWYDSGVKLIQRL